MPSIRIKRYTCSGPREQFSLEEDVYEGWVVLAAQTGSFLFAMKEEGEEDDEGEPRGEIDRWEREGAAGFGELLFCPPATTLWRRALEPMSFVFIECDAADNGLFATIPPRGGKVLIRDVQRLGSSFGYLNELHDRTGGAKPHTVPEHLLGDLLFLVEHERSIAAHLRERRAVEPLMHQAAAYIEQHACSADFTLGALANKLGIAGPQLTRRFQAAYGTAPVAYATEVRLARARRLLTGSDATLDQIADQCGYPNGFYLSRVFTRAIGSSPSVYRKTHRI
ncbi:MAG: helix-turn-helix transcriptional regulator [Paenibacillaceae bacterium]|nr:helix-turn-helix transcriptional regulator [Paenibacillaceae bacterium]